MKTYNDFFQEAEDAMASTNASQETHDAVRAVFFPPGFPPSTAAFVADPRPGSSAPQPQPEPPPEPSAPNAGNPWDDGAWPQPPVFITGAITSTDWTVPEGAGDVQISLASADQGHMGAYIENVDTGAVAWGYKDMPGTSGSWKKPPAGRYHMVMFPMRISQIYAQAVFSK